MREEILLFLSDSYEYKSLNDFLLEKYKGLSLESIRSNLKEMQVDGVIDISGDYHMLSNRIAGIIVDLSNTQISARIKQKGRLELKPPIPVQSIQIDGGVHNSNLNQSSSSLNESISPITQTISKTIANTPIKRSRLERLYWVAGIIIALISIWQIFVPHIFNSHKTDNTVKPQDRASADTIKHKIEYPRHFTAADLQRIARVANDGSQLTIFYNWGDTETVNYANEMFTKLKPIYRISKIETNTPALLNMNDEFEKFSLVVFPAENVEIGVGPIQH